MKKVLVFATMAVIALSAVCGLSGCTYFGSLTYANSDKYSVGDTEFNEKIENIEIDWQSGSVSIASHSESTFLLSEKTGDGISDDFRVHWWLEGTTLHVKYAASGARMQLFGAWHKDLTLTIPEEFSFDDVIIRAASAEINIGDLSAETLDVSTASGDMDINCAANTIRLNSASGNVKLRQEDKADDIAVDTASGKIDVNLGCADKASFESASGKIDVTAGKVDTLTAESTSGKIFCELDAAPSECKLNAVSGKVTLVLPEDCGFTANVKTTSGDFDSDFALKKNGNTYICGDGSADIVIKTTSGDVSIQEK